MKKKSDERKELKELKEMKEMNRFEMKNDEMKLELTRRRSSSHFGSQPGAGVKVVAGGHGALMPLRHSVLRGEAKPKPRRQRFRGEKNTRISSHFHIISMRFRPFSMRFLSQDASTRVVFARPEPLARNVPPSGASDLLQEAAPLRLEGLGADSIF